MPILAAYQNCLFSSDISLRPDPPDKWIAVCAIIIRGTSHHPPELNTRIVHSKHPSGKSISRHEYHVRAVPDVAFVGIGTLVREPRALFRQVPRRPSTISPGR